MASQLVEFGFLATALAVTGAVVARIQIFRMQARRVADISAMLRNIAASTEKRCEEEKVELVAADQAQLRQLVVDLADAQVTCVGNNEEQNALFGAPASTSRWLFEKHVYRGASASLVVGTYPTWQRKDVVLAHGCCDYDQILMLLWKARTLASNDQLLLALQPRCAALSGDQAPAKAVRAWPVVVPRGVADQPPSLPDYAAEFRGTLLPPFTGNAKKSCIGAGVLREVQSLGDLNMLMAGDRTLQPSVVKMDVAFEKASSKQRRMHALVLHRNVLKNFWGLVYDVQDAGSLKTKVQPSGIVAMQRWHETREAKHSYFVETRRKFDFEWTNDMGKTVLVENTDLRFMASCYGTVLPPFDRLSLLRLEDEPDTPASIVRARCVLREFASLCTHRTRSGWLLQEMREQQCIYHPEKAWLPSLVADIVLKKPMLAELPFCTGAGACIYPSAVLRQRRAYCETSKQRDKPRRDFRAAPRRPAWPETFVLL